MTALPPLAIDVALPGLTLVQAEFRSSEGKTAAAIAIFLAGFPTAPLAVGPLADRFGRKSVMLGRLALFTLCGLGYLTEDRKSKGLLLEETREHVSRARAQATRSPHLSARCSPSGSCRGSGQARWACCRAPSCETCSRAMSRAC